MNKFSEKLILSFFGVLTCFSTFANLGENGYQMQARYGKPVGTNEITDRNVVGLRYESHGRTIEADFYKGKSASETLSNRKGNVPFTEYESIAIAVLTTGTEIDSWKMIGHSDIHQAWGSPGFEAMQMLGISAGSIAVSTKEYLDYEGAKVDAMMKPATNQSCLQIFGKFKLGALLNDADAQPENGEFALHGSYTNSPPFQRIFVQANSNREIYSITLGGTFTNFASVYGSFSNRFHQELPLKSFAADPMMECVFMKDGCPIQLQGVPSVGSVMVIYSNPAIQK